MDKLAVQIRRKRLSLQFFYGADGFLSGIEFDGKRTDMPTISDVVDLIARARYVGTKNTWQDAENLDATLGYTSYIWIPEDVYKIKTLKLHVYAEKFRAYSKSALSKNLGAKTSSSETPTHSHYVSGQTAQSSGAHDHVVNNVWEPTSNVCPSVSQMRAHSHTGVTEGYDSTSPAGGSGGHSHSYYRTEDLKTGGVHTHSVSGVTSGSGAGPHSHTVTLGSHDHNIDFGIYEEAITGRTLSAKLYDPDGNLLKDFGVVTTGEDDVELDLSDYFETLKYGTYELRLTASGRLRVRLVYYELGVMFAHTFI